MREDVIPRQYQPRVNGNWDRDQDRERLDNLKGTSQKKVKVNALEFDGRMDPNAFSDWLVSIEEYFD